MTFCEVQECKITTKFNTFLVFAIVLLFLFKMKQYTDIYFFLPYLKYIFQQLPLKIVTGQSKIKKKKSAATENCLRV